jgi:hypothetical protein
MCEPRGAARNPIGAERVVVAALIGDSREWLELVGLNGYPERRDDPLVVLPQRRQLAVVAGAAEPGCGKATAARRV